MKQKRNNSLDPEFIASLKGFDLKAKTIVEGFISGLHKSPHHGFSVEFNQHKIYTPGDEIKSIDWIVYGKTDKFYVKQYEEETNTSVFLMVDSSASMGYKYSSKITKFQYALYLASAIGYLGLKQKDALGALLFDTKIKQFIKPSSKLIQFQNIMSLFESAKVSSKTDFSKTLRLLAGRLKKRSLIVIFSDFLDDFEGLKKSLNLLKYKKHDILLFHILDDSELSFPFTHQVKFIDKETNEELMTDVNAVKDNYLSQFGDFLSNIKKYSLSRKMDYNLLRTSTPFNVSLRDFLIKRKSINV